MAIVQSHTLLYTKGSTAFAVIQIFGGFKILGFEI